MERLVRQEVWDGKKKLTSVASSKEIVTEDFLLKTP